MIDCGILIDSKLVTMSHGGLYIQEYKTWRLRNLIEIDLDYNSNIPNIPKPYYSLTLSACHVSLLSSLKLH